MLNAYRNPAHAAENIEARIMTELNKAREKYGAEGLLPGGNPNCDVLDYMTNELVGITRYAEMVNVRLKEAIPNIDQHIDGESDAARLLVLNGHLAAIREHAWAVAVELQIGRNILSNYGMLTGHPEVR